MREYADEKAVGPMKVAARVALSIVPAGDARSSERSSELVPSEFTADSEAAPSGEFDSATMTQVHTGVYPAVGMAICAALMVFLAFATTVTTADWCAPRVLDFFGCIGVGVAADFVLLQPALVGLTYAFRWVTQDDDGPLRHPTHPYHGAVLLGGAQ